MKSRQSEFHQISSDHVGCGRKRVAKQGRCKKKADILFNLAMSGGMSGVSTTAVAIIIGISVTLNQQIFNCVSNQTGFSKTIWRLYRTSATILFHQNLILEVFMHVMIS